MQSTIELSNQRMATYHVVGRGEPMLWFEGGPGLSALPSLPDARRLADRFAVYLVDPHGSGGSTPPSNTRGYTVEGHARFYREVHEALDLGPATVLGHSFGGSVALAYAALYPQSTTGCVAVAGKLLGLDADEGDIMAERERGLRRHGGAPWYPEARRLWDEAPRRVLESEDPAEVEAMFAAMTPLYLAHPDRPDIRARQEQLAQEQRVDLAAAKAWMNGLYLDIDIRPLLPDVRCPTLLIAGELDLRCGPSQAEQIASYVTHAEIRTIPDSGHFPQFEAPEEFRESILNWAARCAAL